MEFENPLPYSTVEELLEDTYSLDICFMGNVLCVQYYFDMAHEYGDLTDTEKLNIDFLLKKWPCLPPEEISKRANLIREIYYCFFRKVNPKECIVLNEKNKIVLKNFDKEEFLIPNGTKYGIKNLREIMRRNQEMFNLINEPTKRSGLLTEHDKEQLITSFAQFWKEGIRHRWTLGLSHNLCNQGVPQTVAEEIVEEIVRRSGDTELKDRLRAVRDTYTKIKRDGYNGSFW